MLQLTQSAIKMNGVAQTKAQALSLVANAMQTQGLADDFLPFLMGREATASTYLGSGIAIPHGTPEAKNSVKQTGVAVVHFADGVDWGDGNVVYVAVGICAKSDEHLDILRQIARLLDNDHLQTQLKYAKTAEELIALLSGETINPSPVSGDVPVTNFGLVNASSEELLETGYELLKNRGAVDERFLKAIGNANWLNLKDNIWFVQASIGVKSFTQVMVGKGIYENKPVDGLIVMARPADIPLSALGEFLDELVAMEFADLTNTNVVVGQAVLPNAHGLHARPATFLANLAKAYVGEIEVGLDENGLVSAKSLSKLLTLGATFEQTLFIKVTGDDAQSWLEKVVLAIENGLGEQVAAPKPHQIAKVDIELVGELKLGEATTCQVACKGLAIGKAFVVRPPKFLFETQASDPASEKKLLAFALKKVKDELAHRIATAKKPSVAEIFSAHLAMLDDDELLTFANKRIDKGLSAPAAFDEEIQELAERQAALANPILAQRAADWHDIGNQVLAVLCGEPLNAAPTEPSILIKDELLPSDVAMLDSQVVGVITAHGGVNSHSAIIARSLGVPMLVGAGEQILQVAIGETLLLDGERGQFVVSPDPKLIDNIVAEQKALAQKLAIAKLAADKPATTTDNHRIEVAANLGDVADGQMAVTQGAEGVGLLRTEFVFMKHSRMPDKDAQMADYTTVFDAMGERPVVVRTLDVGGDKPLPYLPIAKEENPFLGVRGIRLSLQNPDSLRTQLTALIQASVASSQGLAKHKPLRIMFPMVGQLSELRAAKAILNEVLAENPHNNLQVGMMIEVPSAAILADKFAPEVDFFSIGTNDLTQYALAIDRGHPILSAQADGLDPSVLRFIELTVRAAKFYGKWVGVCGELGADELAVPVLIGLGVDELSVSASQIPLVKAQIRTLNYADCQKLADQALVAESGADVRTLVKNHFSN